MKFSGCQNLLPSSHHSIQMQIHAHRNSELMAYISYYADYYSSTQRDQSVNDDSKPVCKLLESI